MSSSTLEMEPEEKENSNYRTWPDRMRMVGDKNETHASRRPSLSGLVLAKSAKALDASDMVKRPNLATALSSLSISYSPKTRGLHDSQVEDRAIRVPTESQRTKGLGQNLSDVDPTNVRSVESTCDDWNPECAGAKQLEEDGVTKMSASETETEPKEFEVNQTQGEKEKSTKWSKEDRLEVDENQGEVLGQQRFLPTHRKAFSLPRTLEVKRFFLHILQFKLTN